MVSNLSAPVLITGGSGQLGHALSKLAATQDVAFEAVSRPQFDFDRPETLASCLAAVKPWMVINAAAYTAVDAAEENRAAAERANHTGPAHLAALCAELDIPIIHVSTDYVFDGRKGAPYTEQDAPNPCGVYGATKQAGEHAILASGAKAIILRTSWVYGAHGKNFARTMLSAARKTRSLRVVSDQLGTPTAASDLAATILHIVAWLRSGWREEHRGVFHATGAGDTSWHGFATAIFEAAAPFGLAPPEIAAIATADWPTPAKRPQDSRLDSTKLEAVFAWRLPHWRRTLPGIVEELLQMDGVIERLH